MRYLCLVYDDEKALDAMSESEFDGTKEQLAGPGDLRQQEPRRRRG